MLAIAAELQKPAVIHTRAADTDTLAALESFDGRVVLHCFSSPHLLEPARERGWYVSFAGNATFPKAVDLRLAATQMPADRILAETDCPYLAPQPMRGRPNEPAYVDAHAGRARAGARGGAGGARARDRAQRGRVLRPAGMNVSPEEGARPALPRRREHPRRDRPPRRARSRTTSCSRSARVSACSRATSRSGSRTCTRSSSTRRSSRTCATRARTSPCTSATRSGSTSPRSRRTRRSSSRTCRTTSRRRCSSRASTGCRRSTAGA